MKISGTCGLGTVFTIEISERGCEEMARTPNQSPNGLGTAEEMTEHIAMYLPLLELAFAAPEPIRRSLVDILRSNTGRTARELNETIRTVTQVFNARVAKRN